MSKISDIKQAAIEYPGSYQLGVSGRAKLKGVMTSFIAYTNPNNVTGARYIHYIAAGRDYSITSYDVDIYNVGDVKKQIELDV